MSKRFVPARKARRLSLIAMAFLLVFGALPGLAGAASLSYAEFATLATIGGNGTAGDSNGSPNADSAQFNNPAGAAADAQGNVYIADTGNNQVRKLHKASDGTWKLDTIYRSSTNSAPTALAIHGDWLYVAEKHGNRIIKLDLDNNNTVTTFLAENLDAPTGLAVDAAGNVYIADSGNHRVLKVSADGKDVAEYAGTSNIAANTGNGGQAANARLGTPHSLAIDADGYLYIADTQHNVVRKVSPSGIITAFAGGGVNAATTDAKPAGEIALQAPQGLAIDSNLGYVYISNQQGHTIVRVDAGGKAATVAGTGSAGFVDVGSNSPTFALLNQPQGLAVAADGSLIIADTLNHRIRSYTAAQAPDIPTLTATGGNGRATLNWTRSDDATSYTIYQSKSGANAHPSEWEEVGISSVASVTTYTVDNLENGTEYTFAIRAMKGNVGGKLSNAVVVKPSLAPDAPSAVTAVAGNTTAEVHFDAPAYTGDSSIAKYTVQVWAGRNPVMSVDTMSSPVEITGLKNGTSYTFTVTATNSNNHVSASSVASAAVTPRNPIVPNPEQPNTYGNVDIVNEATGDVLATARLTRSTNSNGATTDSVSLTTVLITQAVNNANAAGASTIAVLIPGPVEENSQLNVTLSQAAAQRLFSSNIHLAVKAANAQVTVPAGALEALTNDVTLNIAPVAGTARSAVEQRALNAKIVTDAAGTIPAQLIGSPVKIETNLSTKDLTITLPTYRSAVDEATEVGGIYIEHTNGNKELLRGKFVSYTDSVNHGLQFKLSTLSTFVPLLFQAADQSAAPVDSELLKGYVAGYTDKTFRPERSITRAELAELLSKVIQTDQIWQPVDFKDVSAGSWSRPAVSAVVHMGLMEGYPDGSFQPEREITRAEMATIVYRYTSDQGLTRTSTYRDVSAKHWAYDAITSINNSGFLAEGNANYFRPDEYLTRAEAIAVINRLIGRTATTTLIPAWTDVSTSHWAYADIQAASVDHYVPVTTNSSTTTTGTVQ